MATRSFKHHSPEFTTTTYIDPTATVIGQVALGHDVSIWPMCAVRGDVHSIEIGDRTNIQDNSVLHVTSPSQDNPAGAPLKIGSDVTVGHRVILHACTICDLTLIGMGSIILDGATVEKNVLLGAGSLVPPGVTLTSGYLWLGAPAKKIRPLSDKELAFFKQSAAHYVSLKNAYLNG